MNHPAGRAWPVKRYISVLIVLCCFSLFAEYSIAEVNTEMTTVQGLGYPPIRAENAAQAYLMAKRAAVVDAYRNSLAAKTAQPRTSDLQYEELSGFVSGMTIIQEEYLRDGGIRITARVPSANVLPSAGSDQRRSDSRRTIQSVSLDEWYSIINNLVRYENNQNGGQYEKKQ